MSKKPTVLGAATGAVAGLVAITPAAGFVTPMGAIAIGIVVAIVCYIAVTVIKGRWATTTPWTPSACTGWEERSERC